MRAVTPLEQREVEHKFRVHGLFTLPDLAGVVGAVEPLGTVELSASYYDTADLRLARESIALFRAAGNEVGLAMGIEALAATAAWAGDADRAARLLGYADAVTSRVGGGAPRTLMEAIASTASSIVRSCCTWKRNGSAS